MVEEEPPEGERGNELKTNLKKWLVPLQKKEKK
jgi:hypothetical protein